jgi:hypothetical protein
MEHNPKPRDRKLTLDIETQTIGTIVPAIHSLMHRVIIKLAYKPEIQYLQCILYTCKKHGRSYITKSSTVQST